jgi:putative endonuclease
MREERRYFVYIMSNAPKGIHTGMTNSLRRRVREHKLKLTPSFAAKYNITRLVYFESFGDVRNAIDRESRSKLGLAPSGLRWSNRRILSGMTCRETGISRRHFASRRRLHKACGGPTDQALQAETKVPRFARDDNP